ncbi:selenocysteine-specific translation elongation factor [Chloroflexota bacterium]
MMFVIGTAGHIDHGKSFLVQKLTGIDPDRLREEKERGMTIDLGFAWLKLPSGREVGVVDVPGHERFIKNMLAGVGGIDLALLIVAANEGVMPQTREHLAILNLLEISKGIVVITKKDLVDEELLTLVKMEVEELMKQTTLSSATIVTVSAVTGDGLSGLLSTIDEILMLVEPRKDIGRPRLFIDRVFTMVGSGTVVTGTLIDGSLSVGQDVEVVPAGLKARLRGLQTHKTKTEIAGPGSRVAANLAGVTINQLKRGYVLTKPGWLLPTRRVDVKLNLMQGLQYPLKHGTIVSLFIGAAEVLAKVHLLEKEELVPGANTWAQFAFDEPVAVVKNDHYVIRSPMDTIGGGTIIVSHARRHRRFRSDIVKSIETMGYGEAAEAIIATLELKQPLELGHLSVQCNLSINETKQVIDDLVKQNKVIAIGQNNDSILFTDAGWKRIVKKTEGIVGGYHRKFSARQGMPKGELSSRLGLLPHSPVLEMLFKEGVLIEDGAFVRLPAHQVQLTKEQQANIDDFLTLLNQSPYSPSTEVILEPDLLNLLVEQGKIVKMGDGVVFTRKAYDDMATKIIDYARERGSITLAEVRDMFGTSRKYAKALLEYMDDKRLTRRVGDQRVVR